MKKRSKRPQTASSRQSEAKRANRAARLTIGLAGFEKISAIEGLHLTGDMRAAFGRFDREGASHSRRRALIIKRYG